MIWAGLIVAGALGAVARFVLDGVVRGRLLTRLPVGTMLINVLGSALLGFVAGLVAVRALPAEAQVVAGSGFLGGFTTFSTASFETVRLVQSGRVLHGLASALLTAGLAVGFAALAYAAGAAL